MNTRAASTASGPTSGALRISLIFVLSTALALTGAVLSLRSESADRRSPLAISTALHRAPVVEILGLNAGEARFATRRWRDAGLDVVLEPTEVVGARLVAIDTASGSDAARALSAVERAGIDVTGPERWIHRPGFAVGTGELVAAITGASGSVAETLVFALGEDRTGLCAEAIERLSMQLPPTRPALVLWSRGERIFEMPLTPSGGGISSRRVIFEPQRSNAVGREPNAAELERLEPATSLLDSFGIDTSVPRLREVESFERIARDGPVVLAGSFDARHRELVVASRVDGALDDAALEWLRYEFSSALEPAAAEDALRQLRQTLTRHRSPRVPVEPRGPRGEILWISGAPEVTRGVLGSTDFAAELGRIADLGFEEVALEVHVEIAPPTAGESRHSLPVQMLGFGAGSVTLEGDGVVRVAAARARERGLAVTLCPQFVVGPSALHASRQIHGSPEGYAEFGTRLTKAASRVAQLAERIEADALVLFGPEDLPIEREPDFGSVDRQSERRAIHVELLAERHTARRNLVAAASSFFAGELLGHAKGLPAVERIAREAATIPDSVFAEGASPRVGLWIGLPELSRSTPAALLGAMDALRTAAETLAVEAFTVESTSPSELEALAAALARSPLAPNGPAVALSRWRIDGRGPRFDLARAGEALRPISAR